MRSFRCKILLLSFFLASSCLGIQAQEKTPFSRDIHLGVKGSAIASKYEFIPSVTQSLYIGGGAGVFSRFDIERGASIQLELNYTLTGWKERYDERPDLGYERSIHSINLPLLTHLYLSFKQDIRIFLNLGPVIGYNFAEHSELRDNIDAQGNSSFTTFAKYRHETEIQRKFFWGLCGGPGLSIPFADRHRLELETRYTFGLGDIWSNKRQDPYGNSAERRYSVSINYSYRL